MENVKRFFGISPLDLALAAVTALAASLSYWFLLPQVSSGPQIIFFFASLAMMLATMFRRSHPVSSAGIVYLGELLRYLIAPSQLLPIDVAVLFALYAITGYGKKTAHIFAFVGALFGGLLLWVSGLPYAGATNGTIVIGNYSLMTLIFGESVVVAVWALGLLRRGHFAQYQALVDNANKATREAEREADLAVVEERTRIAREMHDIVAHTLSVVIAQADGGQYAAKKDPSAATRSLEVIAEMTRAALRDIRSIIGVLRESDDPDTLLSPQPVEGDLDELVHQVRNSGYDISLLRFGEPRSLPVGLGNALYRICQEAVTNSMKHAGPHAKITVTLEWAENEIILSIVDDGRGAAAVNDGHGHGLIGIEERAAVFGGKVLTGPRQTGGFEVTAHIPLEQKGTRNEH